MRALIYLNTLSLLVVQEKVLPIQHFVRQTQDTLHVGWLTFRKKLLYVKMIAEPKRVLQYLKLKMVKNLLKVSKNA